MSTRWISFVAMVSAGLLCSCTGSNGPFSPNVDGAAPLVGRTPDGGVAPLIALPAASSLAYDPGKQQLPAIDTVYKRNYLIGEYLAESDQLCSDFLQNLTRVQRRDNLIFGSLSTLFGGLGAAFTKASVVRPLSAAAGIASAERAEIDADTFARQTAQVIIAAIKNSRARTYNNIVQVNFNRSLEAWPPPAALADVADYHARCSLHEGITEANGSLNATAPTGTAIANPGNGNLAPVGRAEAPAPAAAVAANATIGAATAAAAAGASPSVLAAVIAGSAAAGNPGAPAAAPPVAMAREAALRANPALPPSPSRPSQIIIAGPRARCAAAASQAVNNIKRSTNALIGKITDKDTLSKVIAALATVKGMNSSEMTTLKAEIDADTPRSLPNARDQAIVAIQRSICSDEEANDLASKVTPLLPRRS